MGTTVCDRAEGGSVECGSGQSGSGRSGSGRSSAGPTLGRVPDAARSPDAMRSPRARSSAARPPPPPSPSPRASRRARARGPPSERRRAWPARRSGQRTAGERRTGEGERAASASRHVSGRRRGTRPRVGPALDRQLPDRPQPDRPQPDRQLPDCPPPHSTLPPAARSHTVVPMTYVEDPRTAPPIRWGILGPGGIANTFATAVNRYTRAPLVAVGSRNKDRAERFATQHGIATTHVGYAALVNDPQVDAVYVASPHSEHHDHALLAIAAGKHVLVEKSFARNAAEAQEVVDAARAAGVFCMEAMWTRFLPHVVALRANDFSTSTCLPAAMASKAWSWCSECGEAT